MPITDNPGSFDSGKSGRLPIKWCGKAAVDGTKAPWKNAPLGSEYTRTEAGSVGLYQKTANAGANADWLNVATNVALS